MPYYVLKSGDTWRLTWQEGKRIMRHVSKDSTEARQAGFRTEMTIDQAKSRAKQLQSENWVKREADKQARSKALLEKYRKLRGAFLTDSDAEEFEKNWLKEKNIRRSHWHTMQRILVDCATHPSEWYKRSSVLYEQFVKHRYSPAYCKKLLRYLNIWGYFLCERQNRAWKDVEAPAPSWSKKIRDAYEKRIGKSSFKSQPLTPALLDDAKPKLDRQHFNWLFLSLWFGLRPREVNNLRRDDASLWYIDTGDARFTVLAVFQEKLYERGIRKEDCWKYIPIVEPEQMEGLKIVRSGEFRAPLNKNIQRIFAGQYTRYAGRQGFHDLMRRQRGHELEDVSKWYGHLTLSTTQRQYPDQPRASFKGRKAG